MCSIEISSDREVSNIKAEPGQTVANALISSGVPPSSVVVLAEGRLVADAHVIDDNTDYKAIQLEKYDLGGLRSLYELPAEEGIYSDQQVSISPDGNIESENSVLTVTEFKHDVEQTLVETIERYDLLSEDDTVTFGLSGGVDSTVLLAALCNVRDRLPEFDIKPIIVEEPWTSSSQQALEIAESVAEDLNVEHQVRTEKTLRNRYGLTCSVGEAIQEVSESKFSTHTVAITDQIITREIEDFVRDEPSDVVFLAAHTTDVVERYVDPMSDDHISGFPENTFGGVSFRYPGIYLSKKQLAIYLQVVGAVDIRDQFREQWTNQPGDESLLYYIADLLQWYWPGIEYWIVESNSGEGSEEVPVGHCSNCGKTVESAALGDDMGVCITCDIFRDLKII